MTVAITIPTINRSHYLELAIASVQAQTIGDWRLLVVDDGSTDATAGLVDRLATDDARISLFRQQHKGAVAARNEGIRRMGDAAFAAFLDDDDIWVPNALETLLGALERDPTKVAAHGLAQMIDAEGDDLRPGELEAYQLDRIGVSGFGLRRWPISEPTTFSVFAFGDAITTPGQVLIRRDALDRAGLFEGPSSDWQMWLRLSREGPFVFVPQVVIGWRWHQGNTSRREAMMTASRLMTSSRLLFATGLVPSQRRAAWIGFARYYLSLSRIRNKVFRLIRRSRAR